MKLSKSRKRYLAKHSTEWVNEKLDVKAYYKKQKHIKSGIKPLAQHGMSALERKSEGHTWNKLKDKKGNLTKWEKWNWVTKEMVKIHGLK